MLAGWRKTIQNARRDMKRFLNFTEKKDNKQVLKVPWQLA
jgi:hypothetical protein